MDCSPLVNVSSFVVNSISTESICWLTGIYKPNNMASQYLFTGMLRYAFCCIDISISGLICLFIGGKTDRPNIYF